jgi:plasmid replication initiation protein
VKKKRKNNSKKEMVVYQNNFIEAFYQVDFLAKKIMIASSLRCRESDWSDKGCEIIISSNEIRELAGINRNSLKHLEHAVKKLAQTVVTLKNPDNPKDFIIFNYLPHGEYREGVLKMVINRDMKPFVMDLQKNFTQYHIDNIRPLKSEYSIRIFELLKMHAFKDKKFRIMLVELRKMFGLQDKYSDYNMFKKRVIEKAKNELKKHCEIYFEYREIKKGRKVNEIEFDIIKQRKEFSDYEDVLDVTIKDEVLQESVFIKTEFEGQLNELGWTGDFEELVREISFEAIEHYYDILKTKLKKIDKTKISILQLHEYIDGSIKAQARRYYDIYCAALKVPSEEEKKDIKKYSPIAKELIKLGFIGDVESYIESEGRGLVEEAFELFRQERPKRVKNKIGLLRGKIKALKIKKEIEEIDKEEGKTYEKNIFLDKLEKYKTLKTDFSEDYKRFMDIPSNSNPSDQNVLQKHFETPLNELPSSILKEFVEWRVS